MYDSLLNKSFKRKFSHENSFWKTRRNWNSKGIKKLKELWNIAQESCVHFRTNSNKKPADRNRQLYKECFDRYSTLRLAHNVVGTDDTSNRKIYEHGMITLPIPLFGRGELYKISHTQLTQGQVTLSLSPREVLLTICQQPINIELLPSMNTLLSEVFDVAFVKLGRVRLVKHFVKVHWWQKSYQ